MNHIKAVALAILSAGLAASCTKTDSTNQAPSPNQGSIDQASLCEVTGWQHDIVKAACKPGQKVVFLPQSWGNEQLPVLFAAVNCDLRYSVAMSNGGVSCIFSPITVNEDPTSQPTDDAPDES